MRVCEAYLVRSKYICIYVWDDDGVCLYHCGYWKGVIGEVTYQDLHFSSVPRLQAWFLESVRAVQAVWLRPDPLLP